MVLLGPLSIFMRLVMGVLLEGKLYSESIGPQSRGSELCIFCWNPGDKLVKKNLPPVGVNGTSGWLTLSRIGQKHF